MRVSLVCRLFFALVLTVGIARAVGSAPPPLLDSMTDEFEAAATQWESRIADAALRLFFLLGTLDVVWTGLLLAMKGSGLQEFAAELIRRLLFIGFFLALLLNAHDWSRSIVNSFQQVGAEAVRETVGPSLDPKEFGADGELKPSAVAAKGILYSRRITNSAPSILKHPGGAVFFGLAAISVTAGFAAIAARQVLVLAEMYVILSAGIILLGFGATRWSSEYALKYLKYCVSVGIKLMFVQISVALALHFLATLTTRSSPYSFTRASSITMSVTVLVVLIWTIPNIVSGFLQGESATTGSEMMLSGRMMSSAVGSIGSAAASGGQAVIAAAKLSAAQGAVPLANNPRNGGSGLMGGLARPAGAIGSFTHRMAANLGKAAVSAAREGPNDMSPSRGEFTASMARTLENERKQLTPRDVA